MRFDFFVVFGCDVDAYFILGRVWRFVRACARICRTDLRSAHLAVCPRAHCGWSVAPCYLNDGATPGMRPRPNATLECDKNNASPRPFDIFQPCAHHGRITASFVVGVLVLLRGVHFDIVCADEFKRKTRG